MAGARRDPRSGRLCSIRSGGLTCNGEDGRFGQWVYSLTEDSRDNLWAVSSNGLWRWTTGEPQFYPLTDPPSGGLQVLASSADGELLLATRAGVRRYTSGERGSLASRVSLTSIERQRASRS